LANGFLESGLKKIISEKGGILAYLFGSARFLISECKATRRCLQVFRYDIQGDREKGEERKRKEERKVKEEHRTQLTATRMTPRSSACPRSGRKNLAARRRSIVLRNPVEHVSLPPARDPACPLRQDEDEKDRSSSQSILFPAHAQEEARFRQESDNRRHWPSREGRRFGIKVASINRPLSIFEDCLPAPG